MGNVTSVDPGFTLLPGYTFYGQVIAVNDLDPVWADDNQWWSFTVGEPADDVFADGFESTPD